MDNRQLRAVLLMFQCIQAATAVFIHLPLPMTVQEFQQQQDILIILMSVIQQFTLLFTSIPPYLFDPNAMSVRNILFADFHGYNFRGRDVFAMISQQRYLFWLNTGETPESFLRITGQVAPQLSIITREGNLSRRIRRYKLSIVNRVLLVFMWARKYPHLDSLALLFDVSPQTVQALLYQGILVLWRYFRQIVTWPNIREWNSMRNTWDKFPNALGCIDVTPHEIYMPSTEQQRDFYSGHRHFHLLNTQQVCDNRGHIRFIQAGFLGSTHDALSFRLMEPIGPGMALDFPVGAVLLADKGYPDIPPLLTPFRAVQLRGLPLRQQLKARRFNRELSRKRIKVEHIFKHLKDYRCVSGIWRQERWLLPVVIELCVFLTERRLTLFQEL